MRAVFYVPKLCFAAASPPRNKVAAALAFPNGVWEREGMDTPPKFEHGCISPNVSVEAATIRVMSDDPDQELRLQGRIKNICPFTLDEVKCDLSYFSADGNFLGLDMTYFAALDEIDPGEVAPFDIALCVPFEATRCVLNVHSKRILQDIGVALKDYVSTTKSEPS